VIFLTGFPGFLGSRLVERRVADGDVVACLVQPAYRDLAERRAAEIEAGSGVDGRVELYEGDVTDPALGLDRGTGTRLAADAAEVVHLAALYDLGVDRGPAEAVNVDGTRHVLAFARAADARLQYASTCYVSGRYDGVYGAGDVDHGPFNNQYEATKNAAERLVRAAMADGLAATIYRPSIVVGDSRTGETQKYDGPYYLIRYLLRCPGVGLVPRIGRPSSRELNVVPRDYVVDAIDYLSRDAGAVGETYQLCDPAPPSVATWYRLLADATGRRTLRIPTTQGLARRALSVPAVRERTGIEPAAVDYLTHPTRYTAATARRDLPSDVSPPPVGSYLGRLVDYVREHPEEAVGIAA
jgi:thioester reductase-like protein